MPLAFECASEVDLRPGQIDSLVPDPISTRLPERDSVGLNNDRTSAQLMDSLYQKLAADLTVDQALSRAKREILQKGGRYSAPYYWAPFQLYRR